MTDKKDMKPGSRSTDRFGAESIAKKKVVVNVNQQKGKKENMDTSESKGQAGAASVTNPQAPIVNPYGPYPSGPIYQSPDRKDDIIDTAKNPYGYYPQYIHQPGYQNPYGSYPSRPLYQSPDGKDDIKDTAYNPYHPYPSLPRYQSPDGKDDIKDTAKIISAQAASTNSCVFCENKGVFYCYECKSPFCKPCRVNHDKLPPSKKHSVIDLKSVNPSTVTRICELHKSEYTFYCTPCNILVCNICVTSDHKEHGMAGIIEKSNELKRLAKSKLSDMKCKLQNLSKVAEKTKIIHIPKLDNESEIAVDKIRSIENDLQKLISTKADIKVNEVQDAAQWKKEELQSVLKNKERIHRKQTAVYESLETLLSEEHAVSFLVSYQTIKRDMCDLTNEAKDDIEPYHTRAPDLKGFLDETISSLQEYRKRLE